MKYFFSILGLLLLSCCGRKEVPAEIESSSDLEAVQQLDESEKMDAHFDPLSWSVKLRNRGDENVFVGTEFYSIMVFSESGERVAGSVCGILGVYATYIIIPPDEERAFELNNNLKGSAGQFICKIYYVDDLREQPRTFGYTFNLP